MKKRGLFVKNPLIDRIDLGPKGIHFIFRHIHICGCLLELDPTVRWVAL